MQILLEICQFALSVAEIGLCFLFSNLLFLPDKKQIFNHIINIFLIVIISTLLFINRNTIFINHTQFPMKAFLFTIPICMIYKTSFFKTFSIYLAYFSSVGLFQILYSFITLLILDDIQFENLVYRAVTPWRLLIYFGAFVCVSLIYYFIKKQHNLPYLLKIHIQRPLLIYGLFGWWMIAWGQMQIIELGHDWVIWPLGTLLITFTVMIIVSKLFMDSVRKETEMNLIAQKEQMLNSYYNDIKRLCDNSLFTSHDFKNHIIILRNYAQNNETEKILTYLDKIGRPMDRLSKSIWCNNEVINLIVNVKLLEAADQQIQVTTDIDNVSYPIDEPDLCSILSNLLDNAIEANMLMAPDSRWLKIRIREIPTGLIIQLENPTTVQPILRKKRFISSKPGHHGYGLKSVETTIQRYGGTMNCTCENNIFCATISFNK